MGHDRGECMSTIHSSEDEEGYPSSRIFTLSLHLHGQNNPDIVKKSISLRKIAGDDADQQFWAEDELSNSESRSIVFKHKRRHSTAHRNHLHRCKSRLNYTSSSSSYLSNYKSSRVKRRRKRNKNQDKHSIGISKSSKSIAKKWFLTKKSHIKFQSIQSRRK